MPLIEKNWRPITFQGVTFPPTLMGISILIPLFDLEDDEDLGDWLMRLTVCCGFTKEATAERCVRCAQRTIDLMLENRQRVLDGIRERLVPDGFEEDSTYRDWIYALQRIMEVSASTSGNCSWSAPNIADARRELGNLIKSRPKPLKDE